MTNIRNPKLHETTRDEIIGQALAAGMITWDELHSHNGPGKFEGNPDRALAVALYALSMEAGGDESTGDVDSPTGYVARIDRWLLLEDSQGFATAIEYTSEFQACHAFEGLDNEYGEWLNDDE